MPAIEPLCSALVSQRIFSYSLDVESYISRLDADSIRSSSSIVIKVSKGVLEEFEARTDGSNLRRQVLGRVSEKPTYLLTMNLDEEHILYKIQSDALYQTSEKSSIDAVRQCDIKRRINPTGGGGFLKLPPNHHFVTPSGIHTTRFLRVADLMQNLPNLDVFSYWLRPYIHRSHAVLADNISITPVILRTLLNLHKTDSYPFDFLPGHVIHEPAEADKIINQLIRKIAPGEQVLCVLSAHSSGRYARRLQEIFSASEKPNALAFVSLFRFLDADTSANIPTLFELPERIGNVGDDQECPDCQKESKTVRIDPYHYYVREREEIGVKLRKKHFSARNFLDTYGATAGALRIHHTDPHDGRHHAFYIDVQSLLKSTDFQKKLRSVLSNIQKPDLICAPDHEAGRSLAKFAAHHLGVPFCCDESDFRISEKTPKDQIDAIRHSRHLLVLDDVVISGSRLDKINCALRESHASYGSFESVTYLVAVARMESEDAWNVLSDNLTKMHSWQANLIEVEKLLFPHWKEKSACPWCIEEKALSDASQRIGTPPDWVTNRLHNLRSASDALLQNPLLTLEGCTCPTMGAQSPLVRSGATALEVILAVSSALQRLRTDPDQSDQLSEDFLTSRVISDENLTRFSEGLLRAALVRLVRPHEWGNSSRATCSSKLLQFAKSPDQRILLGEVSLGMYRGSITCDDKNTFVQILPSEAQPFFRLMLSL